MLLSCMHTLKFLLGVVQVTISLFVSESTLVTMCVMGTITSAIVQWKRLGMYKVMRFLIWAGFVRAPVGSQGAQRLS